MTARPASPVFPGAHATPLALFVCGALCIPPFLLQQDIVVRAALIAVFMLLDVAGGKRVRLLPFVVVAAGIVLFNLVIPTGKVLASLLGFAVTEGALRSGLMKATAMTGLILLSRFSIRPDLRLPGMIGGLMGRSLYYFEGIMNQRNRIDRRDIIGSVDALLLSVRSSAVPIQDGPRKAAGGVPANALGTAAVIAIVAVNWAAFACTLLRPRPFWGG
jgi:hypothetical protein